MENSIIGRENDCYPSPTRNESAARLNRLLHRENDELPSYTEQEYAEAEAFWRAYDEDMRRAYPYRQQ